MKLLTGPANAIMIIIEIITAMIMIITCGVNPTAVKMESKEKTISSKMICKTVALNELTTLAEVVCSLMSSYFSIL